MIPEAKVSRIPSSPTIDSGCGSSSAHFSSVHPTYPMKALADYLPSGNSTPESGTFDTISPINRSPSSTHHLHELKLTSTSDYTSPNSSQRFDHEEPNKETTLLNPYVTDLKKDKRFSSLDTKTTHGESLPERRGFSLPLTMNSTEPGAHPEPIVKVDDKQNADVNKGAKIHWQIEV